MAPAPWIPSDPDFSGCDREEKGEDAKKCRMAWYNYITASSEISIYGSAFWTFFDKGRGECEGSFCQEKGCEVEHSEGLRWYNLNTRGVRDLVIGEGGRRNVSSYWNPGSWGAVVGALLLG